MLKLEHIYKNYYIGKQSIITALKDINLDFEENEFVAILGPSGCGKTTLLNIIGGLDRYSNGDLIIDNKSTKNYNDSDWDAYRNKRIGTIFQSYNLISHLTVLGNVELALTLSGVSKKDRKKRALDALNSVGLKNEANKKPNQLSGGQMQRVAIARAIVNNPGIILADEPTGALDSKTSVQVMDILKTLSKSKLIIMVTHNEELALQYATRIIRIKDGELLSDEKNESKMIEVEENKSSITDTTEISAPDLTIVDHQLAEEIALKSQKKKTSMSFATAINISSRNLLTKKGRTTLTSVAGSFGIIGIALILAVSNGFKGYIKRMETETLASFPISIEKYAMPDSSTLNEVSKTDLEAYPSNNQIVIEKPLSSSLHTNNIDDAYIDYLEAMPNNLYNSINKNHSIQINVLSENADHVYAIQTTPKSLLTSMTSTSYWAELPGNKDFVLSQYDLIGENAHYPENENEVLLTVDKYNRVSSTLFSALGFDIENETISIDKVIGKKYVLLNNDEFYTQAGTRTATNSMFIKEGVDINEFTKELSEMSEKEDANWVSFASKYFEYKSSKDLPYYNIIDDNAKKELYNQYKDDKSSGKSIKIVGVLRPKETTNMSLLSNSIIYYTPDLVTKALNQNKNSEIAKNLSTYLSLDLETKSVKAYSATSSATLSVSEHLSQRLSIGSDVYTTSITIYPKSFAEKKEIIKYLDAYNKQFENDSEKIIYTDLASLLTSSMGTMVDIVSYVLIAFAAISLVVSSVMISIITYVSVIERTKEIGILRSIGARKKDVSRLFKAETFVIGLIAGVIGVLVSYILCVPINLILNSLFPEVQIGNIANLNPLAALVLILISIGLTFLSGWIPSRIAAKKDPVICLRSE